MNKYEYAPLPDGTRYMRLLELSPLNPSAPDEIEIRLIILRVKVASRREFEALSYVWGSSGRSKSIYVWSGKQGSLSVTSNLHELLVELRWRKEVRRLWIDAICIDQDNLQERSQQVLLMPSVYRHAKATIIWLGLSDSRTEKGLNLLRELGSNIDVDWARKTIVPSQTAIETGQQSWALEKTRFPYTVRDSQAILSVINRPWFERLWTRQELHLSRDKATLICGRHSLAWTVFIRAILYLETGDWSYSEEPESLSNRLDLLLPFCRDAQSMTFKQVLVENVEAKCSDPRDRIFAIISMVHPGQKLPGFIPDYTKSISQTYQLFLQKTFEYHKRSELLSCCELSARLPLTPTWVPNWQAGKSSYILRTSQRASSVSTASARFIGEDLLQIGGIQVATITRVIDGRLPPAASASQIAEAIQRLGPRDVDGVYPTGCSTLEAFCRALCVDLISKKYVPEYISLPNLESYMAFLKKVLEGKWDFNLSPEQRSYLLKPTDLLYSCCYISTTEGYLGHGSRDAKPGDKVCVMLGMDSLLILRPATAGRYEVVGSAYLFGLMDAEGILGPLPQGFEAVVSLTADGLNHHYAFLQRDTGRIQFQDPRKGLLPPGWAIEYSVPPSPHDRYVNIDTGEVTLDDPRMTFENLVKSGVPLQEFVLV